MKFCLIDIIRNKKMKNYGRKVREWVVEGSRKAEQRFNFVPDTNRNKFFREVNKKKKRKSY